MVESVLSTLVGLPGSFPKSILEQLFCRKPVDVCLCTKELCSRHYLKNLPEFLKHKAEDCSLHTCNLLKRNFNMELVLSCRHLLEVVGVFRDLVTVKVNIEEDQFLRECPEYFQLPRNRFSTSFPRHLVPIICLMLTKMALGSAVHFN